MFCTLRLHDAFHDRRSLRLTVSSRLYHWTHSESLPHGLAIYDHHASLTPSSPMGISHSCHRHLSIFVLDLYYHRYYSSYYSHHPSHQPNPLDAHGHTQGEALVRKDELLCKRYPFFSYLESGELLLLGGTQALQASVLMVLASLSLSTSNSSPFSEHRHGVGHA
ncbi:hypothetical protein VTK56DRAFT_8588 [Thermocarpiscus australiensis]